MKKFQFLIAVLLIAALLCPGVCSAAAKMDLSSYLSVTYTGTNGEGVARADFDFAAFEYDAVSGWKEGDRLEKLAEFTAVEMTILPEPAYTENLSNGDTFTVQITFDSKLAKKAGYSFSGLKKTFTVEGLSDAIAIDPFAPDVFGADKPVSVFAEGVDPFLMLNLWNNASFDDPIGHVQYRADNDFNFRNNDKITVTAELDKPYTNQGYVLSRTETTLSFSGMDRYVSAAQDLTEEVLTRISDRAYQECVNGCNANVMDGANSYAPWAVEFRDVRVGDYALLAVNNNIEMEYSFLLVPVYKTIATDEWYDMDAGKNITRIWEDVVGYYKFTDLIVHGDGTITYNEDYVEMNGNFASAEAADMIYLDQFRTNYTFTEILLPHAAAQAIDGENPQV